MTRRPRFQSGLLLTALLTGGCAFHPVDTPSGSVTCATDEDCPADARCRPVPAEPTTRMCCKDPDCPSDAPRSDAARQVMASVSDGAAPADAGPQPDVEAVLPPVAQHPDGGLDVLAGDGGIEVKSLVSCSNGSDVPLPPLSGR